MFQWNQPKSYNYLIQNTFHQIQGFIIFGTPFIWFIYPNLVLSATTSGKDNSMESFPVMFDKVKEHIWRDFGPFLQILSRSFTFLGLRLSTALFNSADRCTIGLRSGDWDGHDRTLILLSQNHCCVDLEVCFGSLSCWKVHIQPSPSPLAEATRLSAKIAWYLVEFIMPSILTSVPGPLELKQPQNITDPPPNLIFNREY